MTPPNPQTTSAPSATPQIRPLVDLVAEAIEMRPDGDATVWAPGQWRDPDQPDLHDDGILIGLYPMDADWPIWEVHPAGDEIVVLISGRVDFVLDMPDGDTTIELRAGETCIVPRNVWHRGVVHEPSVTLHATPMLGSEHRPFDV